MDGGEKKEVRRPMNAFLIFCKRHRGFVREKNPDMDNRSVTRVLGDLWANLGDEKKIYTNLAKQYKDAFMKANPNYKWHSADKSQSSSSKIVSKPTNSRVIKNMTEIHSDGTIIPGKLADPEKMGGLNLLLMADKETCEDRSSLPLPSAASFSLAKSAAGSFSVASAQTNTTTTVEQSTVSNSALLQLAEMCTSELQSSNEDKQLLQLNTRHLTERPSSVVSHNSIVSSHKPKPPPKKRARHWSLTEADSVHDNMVDNGNKQCTFGSFPAQKMRCTSLGSTVYSDDRYASSEKCRPTPSRRKLSSSATESIPSPTGPFADHLEDADSPVFSPDASKSESSFSGESKFESFVHMQRNISQSLFNNPAFAFEMPIQPNPVSSSLQLQQPVSVLVAGISKSVSWQERREPHGSDHQLSHASCAMMSPLCARSSLESYDGQEIDSRSERNYNPDFYIWREPGKTKNKSGELTSGCFSPQEPTPSLAKSSLSPGLKPKHSDRKQLEYETLRQGLTRLETSAETESLALSADLKSASSTCPLPCAKASFASPIPEGRIASILSNLNDAVPNSRLNYSNDTLSTLSKAESESEMYLHSSTKEPESSALKTRTFSEGKLKKKWTERMLIEARLQKKGEEEAREAFLKRDPFNFRKNSYEDIEADQRITSLETKPAVFKEDKSIHKSPVSSKYSQDRDLKLPKGCDTADHGHHQSPLICNQPHGPLDAMTSQSSDLKSFSATRHAKLMLEMSAQNLKRDPIEPQFYSDDVRIKSDNDVCGLTKHHPEEKPFYSHRQLHDRNVSRIKGDIVCSNSVTKAEDLSNKQVLNQIAACGKKFMDHIVDRLCKTDFSGDRQSVDTGISENCIKDGFSWNKNLATEIKKEPGNVSASNEAAVKKENNVGRLKKDEKTGSNVAAATTFTVGNVSKVNSLSPLKDEFGSCRKADQTTKDANSSFSKDVYGTSTMPETLPSQMLTEEASRKLDICGMKTTSSSNGPSCQPQWSADRAETCDQSDINEETGVQPVRKSRRANRGQKYQELIKEGFIQPSRERLANRNVERHGRSFGSREEFEKMEMKRTLKRSASERDSPSDCPAISSSSASAASDGSMEKRFTSGDFDLEKEIESLPVCSLDQLDKKKVVRRRCDSDSLGSPSCHRSDADILTLSRTSSSNCQTKVSQCGSSLSKFEVTLSEPSCPALHIPLPKEERPSEPVTGSRKRKARKHCITRISLVDEKTPTSETAAQKGIKSMPSAFAQKKSCSFSGRIPFSSGNRSPTESTENLSSVQVTVRVNSESNKLVRSLEDSKFEKAEMGTVPVNSQIGDVAESKTADEISVSAADILSLINISNGLTASSQPSSFSNMISLKAASFLPVSSNKYCEASPGLAESDTHRRNKSNVLSPLPSQHIPSQMKATVTAMPKEMSTTSEVLAASVTNLKRKPIVFEVPGYPTVLKTETTYSAIKSIKSGACIPLSSRIVKFEDAKDQLLTLSTHCQDTKTSSIPAFSKEELPKKKHVERKPKKIPGGKGKLDFFQAAETLPAAVKRAQGALRKKFAEKRMLSKSSDTPLVSAVISHSDLSSARKLLESGEKVSSFTQFCLAGETSSTHPSETWRLEPAEVLKISHDDVKTTRKDLSVPVVSANTSNTFAFKSQFFPLNVGQCQETELSSDATSRTSEAPAVLPLSNSALKSVIKTVTLKPETTPVGDRLTFAATSEDSVSFPYRPLLSGSVSGILSASSSVNETAKIKPLQTIQTEAAFVLVSGAVSQLSPQSATTSTLMTSDPHSCRAAVSMSCSSVTLHNSLVNIIPSSDVSSPSSLSSLMICTSSAAPTAPLLSLTPPLSSPSTSSSAMLSTTVISVATSVPSTKSDTVSYTVIGSSSVMEAGSPHMIGSPHLPESPSVAIVQS